MVMLTYYCDHKNSFKLFFEISNTVYELFSYEYYLYIYAFNVSIAKKFSYYFSFISYLYEI